jgi:glycosyltransferase involved in cell wall biosynthesis
MNGAEARPPFIVSLVSRSPTPCGVEMFAHGLARATADLGLDSRQLGVDGRPGDGLALWRALAGAGALVVSLPVVAWKSALLTPMLALIIARLRGARPIIILHEWADLHPLRRMFIAAYVLFAGAVLFSSPTVRDGFLSSAGRRLARRVGLMPIPPNLAPPPTRRNSPLLERIAAERAKGRLILGHFGSIYPKKQSTFVLDVARALQDAHREVFVAFIGGFVKGRDDVEARFLAHAKGLGLENSIAVSGYLHSADEIFAAFDGVDIFVYAFAEGLTSRRGSVLTCLESGRPVIVNAARRADEFDHHPVFSALIAQGALQLAPASATPEDFASVIQAVEPGRVGAAKEIFSVAWRDAALALQTALE